MIEIERMTSETVEILVHGYSSGLRSVQVKYAGNNEIEAYKKYKGIKDVRRSMFWAKVRRGMVMGCEIIIDWDVIEVIRPYKEGYK